MARPRSRAPLRVILNGRLVGRLDRRRSGAIDFRYDPDWLSWPHALPVSLSLPLREDRYIGDPVRAVFENLLPDSDALRRSVAARVGAHGMNAFDLLSVIGRDCVGALQFLPDDGPIPAAGTIVGKPIDDKEIARLMRDLARSPLGLGEDADFRISIAGAQEKTALLWHENKWHKPLGTTATTHILKPQIGRLPNGLDLSDSVENEHFCLRLMASLGLPSAATSIQTFDGERVLVIERFDRVWTDDGRLLRRPQEDCCQALSVPPAQKYEADGGPGIIDILTLLKGSDDAEADRKLFVKAQVAFWLIGATDGHAKNFSVFLAPGGGFQLAPLYDVLSAEPSFAAGRIRRNQMKLAMAVGDGRHYRLTDIMPRHFTQTARKAGIGEKTVSALLAELADTLPVAIEQTTAELPGDVIGQIPQSIREAAIRRLGRISRTLNA